MTFSKIERASLDISGISADTFDCYLCMYIICSRNWSTPEVTNFTFNHGFSS